ncbi:uncharacterized protein LOC126892084 [Diabrotica virgifera virgifera]|uniref:Reverse transcriptase domain-containing protein n=1 Tax=Diabrotica virgifera virgifera TaxID=50390 RepID=A0ABM5L4V6_DIAVI|nr:uncharacterized protein LOC126892084 [Diabrotica virgifera virgifera]
MGLPMGGSASPILAEIVMNKLLYFVHQNVQFEFPFLYQYVDDLITAVPRNEVQSTLGIFNSYNTHLQFTVEEEDSDSSVPFLDTRVVRTDNNIICLDWYRKDTNSGRLIPFHSYHPMKQKINTIIGMKNRILKISHLSFKEKNLKLLFDTLIENCYPSKLLKKLLYSNELRNETVNNVNNHNDTNLENTTKYGVLPYIHNLTKPLTRLFSDFNIKIANYNNRKLNTFFSKLKDRTPTSKCSNVVYGLPCECGKIYIGQTSQRLSKRLALHKSDCRHKPQATSLSIHVSENDHRVLYDDVIILDRADKDFHRKFLEMCYINNCANAINHKKDVEHLSTIYTLLLQQNFTKRKKLPQSYVSDLHLQ